MNNKIYTQKLFNLMKKYKVNKNENYTHLSMGPPVYGCFKIKNISRFYSFYNKALEEGTNLHIIEKHKEKYGPIIIDIDFRQKEKERKYNIKIIKLVIQIYNKYIEKYINIDNENYNVYITEKEIPNQDEKNKQYKDGFHLIYPDICINYELQYIIRNNVVNEFKSNDYFNELSILNNYEDIFDRAVIENNGWLLYGSRKPDKNPYLLTNIIDKNLNLIDFKNINKKELPLLLSIRNNDDSEVIESCYGKEKIQDLFKELNINKKSNNKKNHKRLKKKNQENINKARELIKFLLPSRADNYHEWLEIGWCLHNIDNIELLEDWIDFSSMSDKFDSGLGGGVCGECEKKWENFNDSGLNIGSLVKWAQEDNLEKFNNWLKEQQDIYIGKAISGTSGDVAEAVYQIKSDKYICAHIRSSTWYEFINNSWKLIESGYTLYNYLNTELSNLFIKKASYYSQKKYEFEPTSNEFTIYETKENSTRKVSNKLLSKSFKDEVMSELKYKFYDELFYEKLDENRDLIGFKNGVYDLDKGIFRNGTCEDYISLSTKIDYIEYDENNEHIQNVKKFFSEIQPDKEMYNYVLNFFANCLSGQVPDEKFNIWTGCGSNGKSIAINLFQDAMGDYATTISITLLTKSRASSNSASPELAKCKGIRFVVFQEPENDDKIYVGHMKELTGGDKISARKLFKEPVDFYPQFKTLLTCNKLPFIPSNDGGTWRRLRVVPFEIEFTDNPTEPHQRKKDNKLKNDIKMWNEALMSLLIYTFNKNKNKEHIDPQKVSKFTKEYQKNSDFYLEFINDNIETTSNNKNNITVVELYSTFKFWYKEAHTDKKLPNRIEFKNNIEEKFGKVKVVNNKQSWRCIKFIDSGSTNFLDE